MSIRDMKMLSIGETDDTGGTETTGTVMAKENAILQAIKENMAEWRQKKYASLKTFTAQVSTSNSYTTDESGYRYHTKSYTIPANIRIIGIYQQSSGGGTGSSAPATLKIGDTTYSFTATNDAARYFLYFAIMPYYNSTLVQPTMDSRYQSAEVVMAAILELGTGMEIGSDESDRQLTLTLRYYAGGSNPSFCNLTFYYIEEEMGV